MTVKESMPTLRKQLARIKEMRETLKRQRERAQRHEECEVELEDFVHGEPDDEWEDELAGKAQACKPHESSPHQ